MQDNDADDEKPFYQSKHYFDLDNATSEISGADGVKDTTAAVAKLAGKTLFNVGLLASKTSFFLAKEIVKNGPTIVANMAQKNIDEHGHRMTAEQRARAEEIVQRVKGN